LNLSSIKIDSTRIDGGEWVEEIPGLGDLRLKVRGAQCAAAKELRAKMMRALPRSDVRRDGSLPVAVAERIQNEVLAGAILLDWDNLAIDDSAEKAPFSPDLARKLLADPDYDLFRAGVAYAAEIVQAGRAEHEEDLLGNSKAP
jgi:hypothetical protein